ncbi:MAG: aspartyl/asparaginyl beta-hydroxylase domain-containing protein [Deltaproteobacteria bacterium]|nr:aspartyl/asparaginyl beta-hydroxylase domain-containing protein [Deltaproteobacteria bacterium]
MPEEDLQRTKFLKLPFSFDRDKLEEDLSRIADDEWINHFNVKACEKRWCCVPLRSVEGKKDHIVSSPHETFEDTEILDRCPYFREVIDSFNCEKTSVRLMSLEAGGIIKEHSDGDTSLEDGMVRLHIPIQTDPEVIFTIGGEKIHFSRGDTWYINAHVRHGVQNKSNLRRIHLMLDCPTNPWLEKVFKEAGYMANKKPKYGDPGVTDENVREVIRQLKSMGTKAGDELAEKLTAKMGREPAGLRDS